MIFAFGVIRHFVHHGFSSQPLIKSTYHANANASLNLYLKIPHSDRDGKSISNFTVKHLQAIWDMCSRTLFIIYMHVTGLHILFDIAKPCLQTLLTLYYKYGKYILH